MNANPSMKVRDATLRGRTDTGAERKDLVEWWRAVDAHDIMSSPAICIDTANTVPEAYELMQEHKIRRLPVLREQELVGIITLGDVRGALPSEVTTLNRGELDYLMGQVKVERMMHHPVIHIGPDTKLAEAARLMVKHRISGLPVVSGDGVVIGMVTESDIFRILIDMLDPSR